jgi:hypothetical protein
MDDPPIIRVMWIAQAWAWAENDTRGVVVATNEFVATEGSVQKEKLNALPTE